MNGVTRSKTLHRTMENISTLMDELLDLQPQNLICLYRSIIPRCRVNVKAIGNYQGHEVKENMIWVSVILEPSAAVKN